MAITHEEFGCNIEEIDESFGSIIIPSGPKGDTGNTGTPGYTPYIDSETGFWFINGVSTGIPATGSQGIQGQKGDKGDTGDTPSATNIVNTITAEDVFYTDMKALKRALYPYGMITMWSGDPNTYFNGDGTGKKVGDIDMRGWGLCTTRGNPDTGPRGNAGAGYYYINGEPSPIPDMSDRFVVGFAVGTLGVPSTHSSEYETVRNTGRNSGYSASIRIDANNLPAHTHILNKGIVGFDPGTTHTPIVTASSGVITNNMSALGTSTGNNSTTGTPLVINDVRPPFFVVAYIIKIDEIDE